VGPDVAPGTPRVGDAHTAADRGVGGRRAPAGCQWDPARPADDWGGHAHVRTVLSMGTLVATHDNPRMQALDERLLAAGQVKNVALTACMQQFLTILNAASITASAP